jgi:hypothetical protein
VQQVGFLGPQRPDDLVGAAGRDLPVVGIAECANHPGIGPGGALPRLAVRVREQGVEVPGQGRVDPVGTARRRQQAEVGRSLQQRDAGVAIQPAELGHRVRPAHPGVAHGRERMGVDRFAEQVQDG